MNSILRVITLALFVSLAISAATGTFASPTELNTGSTTTTYATNGYLVTLSAAGWVYGDAIDLGAMYPDPSTTWVTLTASTGTTGVGLIGDSCTTPWTATNRAADTFAGLASNSCPADFATIYTSQPAGATSGALAGTTLTVNNPVSYVLEQPTTGITGNVIGIAVNNNDNNNAGTITVSTAGASSTTGTTAQRYATASLEYAFYVETSGTATVCFQTVGQHTLASGNCNAPAAASAKILSATISGFVAMFALIFFN